MANKEEETTKETTPNATLMVIIHLMQIMIMIASLSNCFQFDNSMNFENDCRRIKKCYSRLNGDRYGPVKCYELSSVAVLMFSALFRRNAATSSGLDYLDKNEIKFADHQGSFNEVIKLSNYAMN
jgi:hypothetical protein